MHRKNIILGAALALAGSSLSAQAVYRCGSSYTDRPCSGGSEVAAPHRPSEEEAARATSAAAVDGQRAAALEKARLEREKNAPKAIVIAAPQVPPVATPKKKGKLEEFTAVAPGTANKKKKKK